MIDPACYSPFALLLYFADKKILSVECLWAMLLRPQAASLNSFYVFLFLLTVVLESPIYWRALPGSFPGRLRKVALLNLATHPIVNFLIPRFVAYYGGHNYQFLLIGETFAPLVEAALLYQMRGGNFRSSLSYAVLANLFSWSLGVYLLRFYF